MYLKSVSHKYLIILENTSTINEDRSNDRIYQRVVNEHVATDGALAGK